MAYSRNRYGSVCLSQMIFLFLLHFPIHNSKVILLLKIFIKNKHKATNFSFYYIYLLISNVGMNKNN